MKVLVTGGAGFIGHALCLKLVKDGYEVITIDNLNSYYDINLKLSRLTDLGISNAGDFIDNKYYKSDSYNNLEFLKMQLHDKDAMDNLFSRENFDYVINLAAQAGVRYSITNPRSYIESNIDGFINILEGCRNYKVKHLVYASSSSVYGLNGKVPFSEKDSIAHPVSLYAATKKANELMAHSYSQLYNIPTTGLRFFTVYGPYGRPDMSPFLFIDAILHDREINVFNNGDMIRDFTYIDDIVEGITRILTIIPESCSEWNEKEPDPSFSRAPYRIYNIGNSNPVMLGDYIKAIENAIGHEARKNYLPMQPGDVYQTNADCTALAKATGFKPSTPLQDGINRTVAWFKDYYKIK